MADLTVFLMVAEERSFIRAARRLGMSQSALSQIVRRLEERLRLRLLSRTTRSVAPTEVGERLIATLAPMLRDMDQAIASLGDLRDRPAGTIGVTTVEHAAKTMLVRAPANFRAHAAPTRAPARRWLWLATPREPSVWTGR